MKSIQPVKQIKSEFFSPTIFCKSQFVAEINLKLGCIGFVSPTRVISFSSIARSNFVKKQCTFIADFKKTFFVWYGSGKRPLFMTNKLVLDQWITNSTSMDCAKRVIFFLTHIMNKFCKDFFSGTTFACNQYVSIWIFCCFLSQFINVNNCLTFSDTVPSNSWLHFIGDQWVHFLYLLKFSLHMQILLCALDSDLYVNISQQLTQVIECPETYGRNDRIHLTMCRNHDNFDAWVKRFNIFQYIRPFVPGKRTSSIKRSISFLLKMAYPSWVVFAEKGTKPEFCK